MKRHTVRQRLAAVFLAALMSLSCLPPLPVFAEDGIAETVSAAETDFSVSEDEATPETAKTESNSGEDVTSESGTTQNEQAQAFVDAVTALDRESILGAVNTWALASQAWQAEKDNPDLTAALEIATAASDEAAAPVYAAEDLYNSLTDEERAQETVQNAYSALAALIVTMQLTMENPTAPEESGGNPPDEEEIATVTSLIKTVQLFLLLSIFQCKTTVCKVRPSFCICISVSFIGTVGYCFSLKHFTVLRRGNTFLLLENTAEIKRILITDNSGYFCHIVVRGFQKADSVIDSNGQYVLHGRFHSHLLEIP